jgi:hypothetical protein
MENENLLFILKLIENLTIYGDEYQSFELQPLWNRGQSYATLEFDSFSSVEEFKLTNSTSDSKRLSCNNERNYFEPLRLDKKINITYFDNNICGQHPYLYYLLDDYSTYKDIRDRIVLNPNTFIFTNTSYNYDSDSSLDYFLNLVLKPTFQSEIDISKIHYVVPIGNPRLVTSHWSKTIYRYRKNDNVPHGLIHYYTNFSHYYSRVSTNEYELVITDTGFMMMEKSHIYNLLSEIRNHKLYLEDGYTTYVNRIGHIYKYPNFIPNTPTVTTTFETFTFNHPTTNPVRSSNYYPPTESVSIRTDSEISNVESNSISSNTPNDNSIVKTNGDSKTIILISLLVVIPIVIAIISLIVVIHYRNRAASQSQEVEFLARIACQM